MKTNYRIIKENGKYKPQSRNPKATAESTYEWLYIDQESEAGYETKELAYAKCLEDSKSETEEVVMEMSLSKGKSLFEQDYETLS